MTARRNTKEVVAKAALRLFAAHGYDGVSMRDIAAAVNVKPASLYKHFSGKQALFDAVVERMDAAYERFAASLGTPTGSAPQLAAGYAALSSAVIEDMAEAQFRYWTEDEEAVLYRRLLTREQYRDAAMGALYRRHFADGPIAYQGALFDGMVQAGAFAPGDGRLMALEFFAPLMTLMQMHDGCEDDTARAEIVALVRAHVERFGRAHAPTPAHVPPTPPASGCAHAPIATHIPSTLSAPSCGHATAAHVPPTPSASDPA